MNKDTENSQDLAKVSKMDDLDNSILTLKLRGFKIVDIAEELSRDRNTVKARMNKDHFQEALKKAKQSALDILLESQIGAANTLKAIAEDENARDIDRIAASKEILKGVLSDKIGFDKDFESNISIIIQGVNPEDTSSK